MEYKRLSRCGIDGCKQTQFHLEAGQWYCKIGHLREGEIDATADDEGFGPSGRKAARASAETKRVAKVLRGRKGFELYIQCYQIILQKQVWWLIHEQGYPEELEVIVKDLWALRLQILSTKLSNIGSQSTAPSQSSQRSRAVSTTVDGAETDGGSSQSSYLYTSDSDSASTTRSRRRRRKAASFVPKASERPKLIESIALCYLGMVLLRCAISLGDIHRWVDSQGLAYLRAIKVVPEAIKEKLSAEYYTALDPGARLRKGRLYKAVQEMVVELQEKFGVIFPPISREILLLRYINELGLPLEIYTAVKQLSNYLFLNFSWPPLVKTKRVAHWPEARLMALVIIAMKLCYGLDDIKRIPHNNFEPPATVIDWEVWNDFLRTGNENLKGSIASQQPLGSKGGLEIDLKEGDVFNMDNDQMDAYMDWYEKTWCDQDDSELTKLSQGILNLFPTSRAPEKEAISVMGSGQAGEEPARSKPSPSLLERLEALHTKTKQQNYEVVPNDSSTYHPLDENKIIRPGEWYPLCSLNEEIPNQMKIFMQAGADLLAIERDDLMKVIIGLEVELKENVKKEGRRRRSEMRKAEMTSEEYIEDDGE